MATLWLDVLAPVGSAHTLVHYLPRGYLLKTYAS